MIRFNFNLCIIQWKIQRFIDKLTGKEKLIKCISEIGYFYVDNIHDKKSYAIAREKISSLGITNISLFNNVLTITLQYPGLLIGRRGENINRLTKYLCEKIGEKITINIKENRCISYLFPICYMEEDFMLDYE